MNDLPPSDLPDVIEDFFRLLIDALIYYHTSFIPAPLCSPLHQRPPRPRNPPQPATSALTLQQGAPLTATLHFLCDFLSYGTDHPNSSNFDETSNTSARVINPPEIQQCVKRLVAEHGEVLTQRILTGMMFSFPRDCFQDASSVLLALFEILPQAVATWVRHTIQILPAGTVKAGDGERLMSSVAAKLQQGEVRKVRVLLQDFTNSYRRRNVAPREGLGRLEATRFRFSG